MSRNIVCGKFDNKIHFNLTQDIKIVRIGSLNPKYLKHIEYIPIATDGKFIIYNNKKLKVRIFLENFNNKKLLTLIVLTNREKELILSELLDFNININVFEKLYPIFDDIKYISNAYKMYAKLISLMNEINKLGFEGKSLTKLLSTKYLYKIERKLRFKTNYDEFFSFAYKGGYQEVFKLKEERKDRVVIAMDFNSMYIDSMNDSFVSPKNIKYKNYRDIRVNIDNLLYGLYRVILKNPKDTFFNTHHPFKFTRLFKSFYFNLETNHSIEILLFKNEIEFYIKYFNTIEFIEGFISKQTVKHPLLEYSSKIYEERLKYKMEDDNVMNNLMKLKLITIHASTNPKKFQYINFKSKKKLHAYISNKYMLNFSEEDVDNEFSYINNQKVLMINKINSTEYHCKFRKYNSNESIYSFSSQIIANSRLKMLKTIEMFLQHTSVEICYANIDSIHISIKKKEVNDFLSKFNYMISDKIGDLKIESISDKGYWFDIGRYWLLGNNKVDKFKNCIFNYKGNNKTFLRTRKLYIMHKDKTFRYIKEINKNLIHSFSYDKRISKSNIDNVNYNRYNFEEIRNLNVANETKNEEILLSKKYKIDLFDKLATV